MLIVKNADFVTEISDKIIIFAQKIYICAMVVKTKERLIEVAQQLFLYKGVDNTTMNDIATASEKGRRTIYTYFKNKKEIYNAIIERESEKSVSKLREILALNLSPVDKLRQFLEVRFGMIKNVAIIQTDSIKTFFVNDINLIDRIKELALEKEREIANEIIEEGVAKGVFDRRQCSFFESLRLMIIQGFDYTYLRDNFIELGIDTNKASEGIINFILNGIRKK